MESEPMSDADTTAIEAVANAMWMGGDYDMTMAGFGRGITALRGIGWKSGTEIAEMGLVMMSLSSYALAPPTNEPSERARDNVVRRAKMLVGLSDD